MKAIAFSLAVLVHGAVLDVPDFAHYTAGTCGVRKQNGISIRAWDAIGPGCGWQDLTLKPPALHQFTIPPRSSYPSSVQAYWLNQEATYVIVSGHANIPMQNGSATLLRKGELFYSAAGLLHGPIKNTGWEDLVVLALTDFTPQYGQPPAFLPEETSAMPGQVARKPTETWTPYPGHECLRIQKWDRDDLRSGALAVQMLPGCTFPFHYHPTGAFYFFTHGKVNISGDLEAPVTFQAGDARWSRPGWAYGPEFSLVEARFFVLGVPPTLTAAPNFEELVVRKEEIVQVAFKNTQLELAEKSSYSRPRSRQRAHGHLRNQEGEIEEAVLVQEPFSAPDEL